jgi:hypothetical protein
MAFSGEQKFVLSLQLAKTESIITVQRGFGTKCHTEPPTDKRIRDDIGNSRKRVVCVPQKEQAGQGHRLRMWIVYENSLPGALKNQHVEQAENWKCLLSIFIWKFAVTSVPLYLSVRLEVRLGVTKTPHLFPGRPGHPTSLHVTLSSGNMLKIKFCVPPLPRDLPELRQRIVAAVDTIEASMKE